MKYVGELHGLRTPHGVRGLKSEPLERAADAVGRTPHGVRGLKYHRGTRRRLQRPGRTPHGVRGLKSRVGGTH